MHRNDANINAIKSHLHNLEAYASKAINEWSAKLAVNPIYALEWSDAIYVRAAEQEMALQYLDLIAYGQSKGFDEAAIQAEIRKTARKDLLHRATQNTNKSTGQGTNLISQARVEVHAKFVEWLA